MPYRDEHEALLSKVELLEADLERERARAAELEESAERAEALEETLEHVEAQLRVVRGETPPRRPAATLALALTISAVVTMSMFAIRGARPPGVVYLPHPAPYVQPVLPMAGPTSSDGVFTPIAYRVRASNVVGTAPVRNGDVCDVLVAPSRITPQCRVTISCGGNVVFGGEGLGYLDCAMVDGLPTDGADVVGLADEGDPMLDMNLPRGRFVVSNDRPETWSFTLRVPPHTWDDEGSGTEAPTDERGSEAQY